MAKPRVLICGDIVWAHPETQSLFGEIATVVRMDAPSRAVFLSELSSTKEGAAKDGKFANIVGVYRHNTSASRIGVFDTEIVKALKKAGVRWIAHNGAGYDQIDVRACSECGITVSNTPGAVDYATATTTLYLIISTLRQYAKAERNLRAGKFKEGLAPAHDPNAKTLAIIGMGNIGLQLAKMAKFGLGVRRVLYHNRSPRPVKGERGSGSASGSGELDAEEEEEGGPVPPWCEYFPQDRLAEMFAQADVVSVHVPLRKETEGLVGEKMIRMMKRGTILVNTARGKVVDEDAMIRALEDGHLSAIGLDVYPDEPHVNPRLLEFPQATLLPHMGTETEESQRKMEVRALTNLRDFLVKGRGKDVIPEMRSAAHM